MRKLLLYRCDFLFGERASIIQASKNILPLQRWKVLKKIFNGIAVRKHADHLMDRDSCPFYTSLPMANIRINGYSRVHLEYNYTTHLCRLNRRMAYHHKLEESPSSYVNGWLLFQTNKG